MIVLIIIFLVVSYFAQSFILPQISQISQIFLCLIMQWGKIKISQI